jgi:hypothetical protein
LVATALTPASRATASSHLAKLTDADYASGTVLLPAAEGEKSWIQFEFEKPVTVRDAPTEHGRISFELSWEAGRPCLAWSAERPGLRVSL